jgi:23S rRNA U2552 (ribose-2'-O)-methylase RlmE/FtsJ
MRESIQSTISSKMEIGVEASLAKLLGGKMVNLLSKRMRRVFRSSKSRKVKKTGQIVATSPMVIMKERRK